ncbi:MAG TPA: ABC transporter ATP-binding protein [Burkholderiales bacterium]|nr:ABC transporter ATP-binding protein [Burkholderiales bacterium]
MGELLRLEELSKSYGSLRVTDRLSLAVEEGETLGIIGPNGAGKTTLFNLIGGDTSPEAGRILFRGEDLTREAPFRRCRRGIGRTYQVPHPFAGMTVFENLLVAASFGAGRRERDTYQSCAAVLERTGLLAKANQLAGGLPLLDRKRLEMARALATRPKLLLLDEIAGGLTENEAQALVGMVREIAAEGVTVVWIEHVVHALVAAATRLAVLDFGRVIAHGEPKQVIASAEVQRVYMGIEV